MYLCFSSSFNSKKLYAINVRTEVLPQRRQQEKVSCSCHSFLWVDVDLWLQCSGWSFVKCNRWMTGTCHSFQFRFFSSWMYVQKARVHLKPLRGVLWSVQFQCCCRPLLPHDSSFVHFQFHWCLSNCSLVFSLFLSVASPYSCFHFSCSCWLICCKISYLYNLSFRSSHNSISCYACTSTWYLWRYVGHLS